MTEKTCTVQGCSHTEETGEEIVHHIKNEHSVLEAFGHAFLVNAVKTGYEWDSNTVPQMDQIKEEYEDEIEFTRNLVNGGAI